MTHIIFQTPRLRARHLTPADFDDLYAVYSDAAAMRWVDDGQPISRADCERWIEVTLKNYATRGYGMSALEHIADGRVIGFCGLVHPGGQVEAEIKYAFRRDYWGQGLATEAVQAMLAYGAAAFDLPLVIATVDPDNLASQRVLAKAGLTVAESQVTDEGEVTMVFIWRRPKS